MIGLSKIDDNFTDAWVKYESKAGYYALFILVTGLILFGLVLLLIGLFGAASYPALTYFYDYFSSTGGEISGDLNMFYIVWIACAFGLFIVASNILGAWQTAALWIAYSTPEKLKFSQIFKQAIPLTPRYFGLGLLKGLIIFTGYALFIVPGILFSGWFAFSEIAAQKKSIIESLKYSRSLVTNRWWSVVLRLVLGLIIAMVIPQIVQSVVMSLFTAENSAFDLITLIGILMAVSISIFQAFFLAQWYSIFKYAIYLDAQKSLGATPSELPAAPQVM